jgi:hypothetical protein
MALGVEVDEQHPLFGAPQGVAEIDGGCGLADAALLVRDGDDAGQF